MTEPKLAETPTESKKFSFLSESLDMFNRDTLPETIIPSVRFSLLALNDVHRATQGITAISQLLANSSLEEDNEDGQVLAPKTVFGLLMAINALSNMSSHYLAVMAEDFARTSK